MLLLRIGSCQLEEKKKEGKKGERKRESERKKECEEGRDRCERVVVRMIETVIIGEFRFQVRMVGE